MAGEEAVKKMNVMDVNTKEEASLKRKKVENVALGMAWGAQSVAAARISKIREKEPESVSDFGRFIPIFSYIDLDAWDFSFTV